MTTFLVQHITGGDAFFTGLMLLVVAVVLAGRSDWRRTRSATLYVLVGVALIAVSATSLPWWLYTLFAIALVAWYGLLTGRTPSQCDNAATSTAETAEHPSAGHRPLLMTAVLVLMFLIVAGWELRWRLTPHVPLGGDDRLIILADSVTAGIGEDEAIRWPELLQQRHPDLVIDDRSKMGATVDSALRLIDDRPLEAGVVVIELGGNDLLGTTTLADFEESLDAVLQATTSGDRPVVMFELPLPPGSNAWGLVQRRLANRYGVVLIPKRRFASILLSGETTLDSIHLSQSGHEAMARLIEEVLLLE